MTFDQLNVFFHMVNHYRKLKKVKAVVDCSCPKGYMKKQCYCRPPPTPHYPGPSTPCCSNNKPQPRSCSPESKSGKSSCTPKSTFFYPPRSVISAPPCKRVDRGRDSNVYYRYKDKNLVSTLDKKNDVKKDTDKNKTNKPLQDLTNRELKKVEENVDLLSEPEKEETAVQKIPPEYVSDDNNIRETQEHEYLHFVLGITEDILRHSLYSEDEMEKLFEGHVEANRGRLDEEKMRLQIEGLKKELNLPLPTREKLCQCSSRDAELHGCKCSLSFVKISEECECSNPSCSSKLKLKEDNLKLTNCHSNCFENFKHVLENAKEIVKKTEEVDLSEKMLEQTKSNAVKIEETLKPTSCYMGCFKTKSKPTSKDAKEDVKKQKEKELSDEIPEQPKSVKIKPDLVENVTKPKEKDLSDEVFEQSKSVTIKSDSMDKLKQLKDKNFSHDVSEQSKSVTIQSDNLENVKKPEEKKLPDDVSEQSKSDKSDNTTITSEILDKFQSINENYSDELLASKKDSNHTEQDKFSEIEIDTQEYGQPEAQEPKRKSSSESCLTNPCVPKENGSSCERSMDGEILCKKFKQSEKALETIDEHKTKESRQPEPRVITGKDNAECVDPVSCTSPYVIKIPKEIASCKDIDQKSSIFKVKPKTEDGSNEPQMIVYSAKIEEDKCFCSVSLQKTALKIKSEDIDDNQEYILIDGPICLPRRMLETKTVPVLIETVSSLSLPSIRITPPLRNQDLMSNVNLFTDAKNSKDHELESFDPNNNFDSISATLNKIREMGAEYDLTPQRESVPPTTSSGALQPILKSSSSKTPESDNKSESQSDTMTSDTSKDELVVERDFKNSSKLSSGQVSEEQVKHVNIDKNSVEAIEVNNKVVDNNVKCDSMKQTKCTAETCPRRARKQKIDIDKGISAGTTEMGETSNEQILQASDAAIQFDTKYDEPPSLIHEAECLKKYHYLLMDRTTSVSTVLPERPKPLEIQLRETPAVLPFTPDDKMLLGDQYRIKEKLERPEDVIPTHETPSIEQPRLEEELILKPPRKQSIAILEAESTTVSEPFHRHSPTTSPLRSPVQSQQISRVSESAVITPFVYSPPATPKASDSVSMQLTLKDSNLSAKPNLPGRETLRLAEEISSDLTYIPRKGSSLSDLSSLRPSEVEHEMRSVPMDESVASASFVTSQDPSKKGSIISTSSIHKPEGLKVRYSINKEMYDAQNQSLLAKLDQLPRAQEDRELDNVSAINEKMKEFRKIDDESNVHRRFQITNPDNFEIRRISVFERSSTISEEEEEATAKSKARAKCCGLGQKVKPKRGTTS